MKRKIKIQQKSVQNAGMAEQWIMYSIEHCPRFLPKLAKNWKISRNTEKEIEKLNNENRKKIQDLKKKYRQTQLQAKKDATKETPNENRKNAEEVIQKKLSSLRSSVAFMKDEISKEQDEITDCMLL